MANPIVQFVDSPSTTATLRYDFTVTSPTLRTFPLGADAIDFGVPSFTGEPEGVGAMYGYRSLRFTQRIIGTRAVALARMSLLVRELLRSTNWLKFQWDQAASPVFFKTYRTEPGALSLENAGQADAWDITVPLVADPFGLGPRVAISQFQVIQGPADLTGPTRTAMRVVLPTLKGDAPTPLRVVVAPTGTSGLAFSLASWLVGCVSGKATMADPVVDIGLGDAFTAVSGTGAGTSNAAFFGGSYRAVTIGAGANLLERIKGPLPSIPAGRYKILVRAEIDASATNNLTYLFQMGIAATALTAATYGSTVSQSVDVSSTAAMRGWIDTGDFNLPADIIVPRNATDALPAPSQVPYISLRIGTANLSAGAGVRIDAIKLIPVDGPTVDSAKVLKGLWIKGSAPANDGAGFALTGTFDGDSETFWALLSGGLYPSTPTLRGAFPVADPTSAQNLLLLMAIDHGGSLSASAATITSLNAQSAVDVSYHPRYLHIGDGT